MAAAHGLDPPLKARHVSHAPRHVLRHAPRGLGASRRCGRAVPGGFGAGCGRMGCGGCGAEQGPADEPVGDRVRRHQPPHLRRARTHTLPMALEGPGLPISCSHASNGAIEGAGCHSLLLSELGSPVRSVTVTVTITVALTTAAMD